MPSTALVTTLGQVPAHLRERYRETEEYHVEGGLPIGILSLNGKVFTLVFQGEKQIVTSTKGHPMPFFDVVIAAANPATTKTFYAKQFQPGADAPPDCASSNGVTPDIGVPSPQSKVCADCQHNKWGTALGGTGGKRCSDNKRIAILPAFDLTNEAWGGPMLLRVPPGTFKHFSPYIKSLRNSGLLPEHVVTRIRFEQGVTHQVLEFHPQRYLTEEECDIIAAWRDDPQMERVLSASYQDEQAAIEGETELAEEASEPVAAPVSAAEKVAAARVAARTATNAGATQVKVGPKIVAKKTATVVVEEEADEEEVVATPPKKAATTPTPAPKISTKPKTIVPAPKEALKQSPTESVAEKKARLQQMIEEAERLNAELDSGEEGEPEGSEEGQAINGEIVEGDDDDLSTGALLSELSAELGRIPD